MNNKMIAAVFEDEGKLILKEVPIPVIKNYHDVIIRVNAVAICGTDVSILKLPSNSIAKPNIILGHEMVGIVEKVGDGVKNLKIGDRVVVNPYEYCDNCQYCKMDLRNLCVNAKSLGINVDGGFAKYCKTLEKACYKISSRISDDIAPVIEPLGNVLNGTQKVKIQPWESVVILGGGSIGLLFLLVFKISGASKIILSEVSDYKRKIAKELGANVVINPTEENLYEIVERETTIGADIVVDTVGSLVEEGIRFVRKGGKILLFGVMPGFIAQIPQLDITMKEIQIEGTLMTNSFLPQAISLAESGRLNLEKIVTHKFPLNDINKAFEILAECKALKIIIYP